jgi:hypothetical protein
MGVMPFHEQAMAHWNDEVERSRIELLASLDELRYRADKFLTVSAMATTLLTALSHPSRSEAATPANSRVPDNGTRPETSGSVIETPVRLSRNGHAPYPDADRDGVVTL